MKKLLLLISIFLLGVGIANATQNVDVLGDKNSSGIHRVTADSDGVITFASDTGIKFPYQTGTTSDSLTAAETGTTVVNTSPTYPPVYSLPAAAVGMKYTFVAATAVAFIVDPNGTDIIKYASLSAGDRIISSGAAGDSITFFCGVANQWSVIPHAGSWTDYD